MLHRRRLLRFVSAIALVTALHLALAPRPIAQTTRATAATPLRVLFIGNSYTYFNNLPEVVAALATSLPKGPAIAPTMFATGGMTLPWFWAAGKAGATIDGEPWDGVVLQEQSALGAGTEVGEGRLSPPGLFHQAVRNFVPRIRARGATPVLMMTWARLGQPDDQALLTTAYDDIGRELDLVVAPAGVAWQQARQAWPELSLHVADGSHPNPTGTYLTACVLYATLTGLDPRGATAKVVGHPYSRSVQAVDTSQTVTLVDLDPALARRLQTLAWRVVTDRGVTQRGVTQRGKG